MMLQKFMADGPPILMYHSLSREKNANRYTITVDDFISHLSYLQSNQYKTPYNVVFSTNNGTPEKKQALVTFDDGNESDYHLAFNLLIKFHIKAIFFITTDFIGKPGYMSKNQIQELSRNGFSLQSHGKTHNFLTELSTIDLATEARNSKEILEDIVGRSVTNISFPGGRYNRNVLKIIREFGYTEAFTSVPFQYFKSNSLQIFGRIAMKYNSANILNIEHVLSASTTNKYLMRGAYLTKKVLKVVIGERLYHRLWAQYIGKNNG